MCGAQTFPTFDIQSSAGHVLAYCGCNAIGLGIVKRWCVEPWKFKRFRFVKDICPPTHKVSSVRNSDRDHEPPLKCRWESCDLCDKLVKRVLFFVLSIIKLPMKRRKIFFSSFFARPQKYPKSLSDVPEILSLIAYLSHSDLNWTSSYVSMRETILSVSMSNFFPSPCRRIHFSQLCEDGKQLSFSELWQIFIFFGSRRF